MTNFYNKVSNGDNNTDSWKGFSILNDLLTETLSAKSNMTAISYENYDFTAEAASLEQKIKEEYKNVKQLCKFNFCVQYITINGMKIEADEKMNESKEVKDIYKEVNVNGGESEEEDEEESMKIIKGKKMKLIKEEDNSEESSIKRKNDNVYDNNSDLIIFSSNDEELVNRWIYVVNYFLGR